MPALTRHHDHVTAPRPTKITFAEMREMGVRGLLIYCQEGYGCV